MCISMPRIPGRQKLIYTAIALKLTVLLQTIA